MDFTYQADRLRSENSLELQWDILKSSHRYRNYILNSGYIGIIESIGNTRIRVAVEVFCFHKIAIVPIVKILPSPWFVFCPAISFFIPFSPLDYIKQIACCVTKIMAIFLFDRSLVLLYLTEYAFAISRPTVFQMKIILIGAD